MRRLACLVVAVLTASSSHAAEPCSERFLPDRPGIPRTTSVGAGCVALEGGGRVRRHEAATALSFPFLWRFGIGDIFELRIANAVMDITIPDDASTDVASTPLGLEGKLMALEPAGRAPGVGLLFGAWAPLGDRFFLDLDPRAALLFDWQLVESFGVRLNAGVSAPPVDGAPIRAARFGGALLVGWQPVDRFTVFLAADGDIGLRPHEPWQQRLGGGVGFRVADNAQIDAGTSLEMTAEDWPADKTPRIHPIVIDLGFAWRL